MARVAQRRRRRRLLPWALPLVLIAAQSAASAGTVAGVRVPSGYRVARSEGFGGGVWHVELRGTRTKQVVHVARVEPRARGAVRMVVSNDQISGSPRTEATSSMCRRVRCLVAINGDFTTTTGVPVGGVITGGRPIRSPIPGRRQFSIAPDRGISLARQTMATSLVTTHFLVPGRRLLNSAATTTEPRTTRIDGVNVTRPEDGVVLYTPEFGSSTETRDGIEIVARVVDPRGSLRTGVDTTVELLSTRKGGSAIPSDGVVLSGRGDGASALTALWREIAAGTAERTAVLRVDVAPAARESMAGRELLVHDGRVMATPRSARAPRTMLGWNRAGDVLLVTVDGRQSGWAAGLTVAEGARLMRSLGAVEAINLDGGGSTTFVRKGRVVNRPSNGGRHERRVSVAITVVRA